MRRLILVRHATPMQNPDMPAREWRLSPSGYADAERLAESLLPYAPGAIFASDETKAQQTAQPLANRLSLPVEIMADLREHERRTVGYLGHDAFQATMARFFAEPETLVFGEETAHQALSRFSAAIERALTAHLDGDVALFTHGTVLTLFAAAHGAGDAYTFWWRLNLPAWVVFTVPDFAILETQMRLPE